MNKQRRKEICKAVSLLGAARCILEDVKSDEEDALYNMPESLQESERGEAMSEAVDTLGEIVDMLEEYDGTLCDLIGEWQDIKTEDLIAVLR